MSTFRDVALKLLAEVLEDGWEDCETCRGSGVAVERGEGFCGHSYSRRVICQDCGGYGVAHEPLEEDEAEARGIRLLEIERLPAPARLVSRIRRYAGLDLPEGRGLFIYPEPVEHSWPRQVAFELAPGNV